MFTHTHHILDNITNYICDWLLDYDNARYDANESFHRKQSRYNKRRPHEKQCSSGGHRRHRYCKGQHQTIHVWLRAFYGYLEALQMQGNNYYAFQKVYFIKYDNWCDTANND